MLTRRYVTYVAVALLLSSNVVADESGALNEPPPYKLFRAAEDYSYLANDEDCQYEYDWFVREENELGSIEPGKLADLVVLSDDYLSVPDEKLRSLKSVLSILGGDIVYSDGSVVDCGADRSSPWHRQDRNNRCVIQ